MYTDKRRGEGSTRVFILKTSWFRFLKMLFFPQKTIAAHAAHVLKTLWNMENNLAHQWQFSSLFFFSSSYYIFCANRLSFWLGLMFCACWLMVICLIMVYRICGFGWHGLWCSVGQFGWMGMAMMWIWWWLRERKVDLCFRLVSYLTQFLLALMRNCVQPLVLYFYFLNKERPLYVFWRHVDIEADSIFLVSRERCGWISTSSSRSPKSNPPPLKPS